MNRVVLSVFCIFLFSGNISAQKNTFQKTYGGNYYNDGRSLCIAADGAYVVCGSSSDFNTTNSMIYVLKTDTNGIELWHRTYGGSLLNVGMQIIPTADRGFILTGYTENDSLRYDALLIKIDSLGNQQWLKSYGGTDWDFASSVTEIPGQGYLVAGETYSFGHGNSDIYLIRTDLNGDTLWTKAIGGIYEDAASSLRRTSDGMFIITGKTQLYGGAENDLWLLKIQANGDTAWTKTFGGNMDDEGNSVKQTFDGGFIVCGFTQTPGKGKDSYLIKTDAFGNADWIRVFGDSLDDALNDIIQSSDGDFVASGYTGSFSNGAGRNDFYVFKLRQDGSWRWGGTLGMADDEEAYGVGQIYGDGYVFAGTTASYGDGLTNILIMKANARGDTLYVAPYVLGIEDIKEQKNVLVYPNPFKYESRIILPEGFSNSAFSVYDIQARKVIMEYRQTHNEISVLRGDVPIGMYFFQLRNRDGKLISGKLIIE
jgi:hypothetical protein